MEQITVISASMLVTINGFCVKVETKEKPICFFVDKTFKQVPWKLTITQGIILDQREFWRMRKDLKLKEISLSEQQLAKAIAIAKLIHKDPYLGLPVDLKEKYKGATVSQNTPSSTVVCDEREKRQNQNYTTGSAQLGSVFGGLFQQLKEKIKKTA